MKNVSGYVLAKDNDAGIPRLLVTAYESEKSVRGTGDPRQSMGGVSLGDWGRRIASVLTDSDGRFTLSADDLEFQGNEPRPDLLIVVFAPEDVQGLNAPYPLPPEERVLYISTVPREDAGAEEAFVIRLLQEQLDHFQLAPSTPPDGGSTDGTRFATAIESAWDSADRLRDRLKVRRRQEQTKSDDLHAQAQQKVRSLSAIPSYLGDHGLADQSLLIKGKRDLADNLQPMQAQAVAKGLERLQTRTTVMRLALTESELQALGLTVEGDKVVGVIDQQKLSEQVRAKTGGFDLVRKRGLTNPSPEDLIKKYLLNGSAARMDDKADLPGN